MMLSYGRAPFPEHFAINTRLKREPERKTATGAEAKKHFGFSERATPGQGEGPTQWEGVKKIKMLFAEAAKHCKKSGSGTE